MPVPPKGRVGGETAMDEKTARGRHMCRHVSSFVLPKSNTEELEKHDFEKRCQANKQRDKGKVRSLTGEGPKTAIETLVDSHRVKYKLDPVPNA